MKNLEQRNQIIEFSLKLNSTNLSPLRSGNISLKSEENGNDGYLITPSGKKYETLKPEDIVFMGFNEKGENNYSANKPSFFASSFKLIKTISSGFSVSYFFPDGVIKYPSISSSLPLNDILPDLRGERFVEFNLREYSII